MFKTLIKTLQAGMTVRLIANYRRRSIQLLRIEIAKVCLRAVHLARLSTLGLVQMGLTIGLIGVGAVLMHVALFILLPGSVKARAIAGLVLGAIYVTVGIVALRAALDEKAWLAKSGVNQLVDKATRSIAPRRV